MQAIIKAGGKQYTVSKGQKFFVNRLAENIGDEIVFEPLMILGDTIKVGQPHVAGAKVIAKVTEHKKDKKVVVFKYKRRKGYHKKQGHRQYITQLEIQDIQA